MKKKERKELSVMFDDKFLLSMVIYALGFAFLCTTASYLVITEMFILEVQIGYWMAVMLPLILVLFITYSFGSFVCLGTFTINKKK